jgi:hypothetical protein
MCLAQGTQPSGPMSNKSISRGGQVRDPRPAMHGVLRQELACLRTISTRSDSSGTLSPAVFSSKSRFSSCVPPPTECSLEASTLLGHCAVMGIARRLTDGTCWQAALLITLGLIMGLLRL